MLIIIVPIIFIIITVAYHIYEGYWSIGEICTFSLAASAVGLLIGGLLTIGIGCSVEADKIKSVEKVELLALKDTYTDEHAAFVFSSYSDEELTYTVLYREPQKGIISKQFNANETYVKTIKEGEAPYFTKTVMASSSPVVRFFTCGIEETTTYELYSPPNSLIVEGTYEIDLE